MTRLTKKILVFLAMCILSFSNYAQKDTLSIYFESGESSLSSSHKIAITNAFESINKSKQSEVQIIGYADSKGTIDKNKELSESRASNTYTFIINTFGQSSFLSIKHRGDGEINSLISSSKKRRVIIIFSKEVKPLINEQSIISNLQVGECLALDNLIFEPGQHYLKKESIPYLFELFEILKTESSIKASIEGHVWDFYVGDSPEEIEKAKLLSENRAKNIYEFLIRRGISANRLSYIGYGIDRPLPKTTRDPSKNRRVEIRILEK